MGAETRSVQVISTRICTCCTSLVVRVISDGAPNFDDLALGEYAHPVEDRAAQVPAEAHRRLGTEIDGNDRAGDLAERHQQHRCRRIGEDVAGVRP